MKIAATCLIRGNAPSGTRKSPRAVISVLINLCESLIAENSHFAPTPHDSPTSYQATWTPSPQPTYIATPTKKPLSLNFIMIIVIIGIMVGAGLLTMLYCHCRQKRHVVQFPQQEFSLPPTPYVIPPEEV